MGRRFWCGEENADKISKPAVQPACGAIAQLGERIVRNDEVVGSIPTSSTIFQSLTEPHNPILFHSVPKSQACREFASKLTGIRKANCRALQHLPPRRNQAGGEV
jgi:hypothetical protein